MSWEAWGDDGDPIMDSAIEQLRDNGWWDEYQVERVKTAINELFRTPFHEVRGQPSSGVSVEFIMRMNVLRYEASLADESDPFVAEALAYFSTKESRAAEHATEVNPTGEA